VHHRLGLPLLLTVVLAAGCTVPAASAGPHARTEAQVIDGGSAIPLAPLSPKHHASRLDCRKDSDCAFWTQPCSCPPCGKVWRQVVNRKELARLQSEWARRRCAHPVCESCEGAYLGTKPVCQAGQCAAE
jgi:hypothetical protein